MIVLRGTKSLVCQPDPSHRDLCLPRDITSRLPRLIRPTGYYSMLVVQVSSGEVDERSTRVIKKDFKALGHLVEGTGAQVVFSSIPSIAGMNPKGSRKTHMINKWLKGWYHKLNFGAFDHGAPGLLET